MEALRGSTEAKVMETMIPAWTYGQVWRRYERYCHKKKLDPYSDIALTVWTYDVSIQINDDLVLPPEVEIVDDILNGPKRTG